MKKIKKNIYIIFAIAFLVISIAVSTVIVALNFKTEEANQTSIGHIYIGDATGDERRQIVVDAFETWKRDTGNSGGYTIKYQNRTFQFDPSKYFTLNLDVTLSEIDDGETNELYVAPIDSQELVKLRDEMQKKLGVSNISWGEILGGNDEDEKVFWNEVYKKIGELYTTAEIDMYEYLSTVSRGASFGDVDFSAKNSSSVKVELDVTGYESDAEAIFNAMPSQSHTTINVDFATETQTEKVNEYKGMKILANQSTGFSLLNYVSKNEMGLNSQQLSILGTGLTAIAMQSNFTNIRRVNDTANSTAKYAYYGVKDYTIYDSKGTEVSGTNEYGIATKISAKNNQDLTFYNNDTYDYNVLVDYNKTTKKLTFILVGPKSVNDYTLSATIDEIDSTKSYKNMIETYGLPESESELNSYKTLLETMGFEDVTNDAAFLEENEFLADSFDSTTQYCYVRVNSGKKGANIQYYKNYVLDGANVQDKAFKIVTYEASIEEVQYIIFNKTYSII